MVRRVTKAMEAEASQAMAVYRQRRHERNQRFSWRIFTVFSMILVGTMWDVVQSNQARRLEYEANLARGSNEFPPVNIQVGVLFTVGVVLGILVGLDEIRQDIFNPIEEPPPDYIPEGN